MTLYKIAKFHLDQVNDSNHNHIRGFKLYVGDEQVGDVDDILVDDDGNFRYLVINAWVWFFGKKILLPIGRCRLDYNARRVYVDGISRTQVKSLPEYNWNIPVDYDYEEHVRGVYRPLAPQLETAKIKAVAIAHNRHTYNYKQDPTLYEMNEQQHQLLKLYEEQLMTNKNRRKP